MTDARKLVLSAVEGSIARITLNRPEKRNALNDELIGELKDALRSAGQDETVRCVVIAGAGSDFCSGADLEALLKISNSSISENAADARSLVDLFALIRNLPIPVIAAVHGRALAGGCGLASACDIVLASNSARFGYPEVKIGFVPAIVTAILRRVTSEKRAFELLTSGAEFSADYARTIGLVNRIFDDATFTDDVAGYAQQYDHVSRSAVTLTKSLLYQIDGLAFLEAMESGADVNVIARLTEDCKAGIDKFFAKKSRHE